MKKQASLLLILLMVIGFFESCNNNNVRYIPGVDKSKLTNVDVHIKRYGKALFDIDTNNFKEGLKAIKPNFLLFLNADLNDSTNVNQLYEFVTDTLNRYLYKNSLKEFPDLKLPEQELSLSMSYFHYYFPKMLIPAFYSYISGSYYESPILVTNSVVLIGIDNYLGSSFVHYARLGIPKYKTRWMIKDEIPVDVMNALYQALPYHLSKPKTLLDMMVQAGKQLFFLDATLPQVADSLKIKYTGDQLDWVNSNEKNIWSFLISQKLLFSADFMQTNKLMQDGPFTKGFGNKAPARIGEFIGWKIVSAYMEKHPEITMKKLLQTKDSQMILNKSGYKP